MCFLRSVLSVHSSALRRISANKRTAKFNLRKSFLFIYLLYLLYVRVIATQCFSCLNLFSGARIRQPLQTIQVSTIVWFYIFICFTQNDRIKNHTKFDQKRQQLYQFNIFIFCVVSVSSNIAATFTVVKNFKQINEIRSYVWNLSASLVLCGDCSRNAFGLLCSRECICGTWKLEFGQRPASRGPFSLRARICQRKLCSFTTPETACNE